MLTATAPSKPKAAGQFLTSEEFLDWLEPGIHADLIGGKICLRAPVNLRHAELVNFLDFLLSGYVDHEELGEVFQSVVAVRLSVRETFLPDLSFFPKSLTAHLPPTHAPFAPTFVMEALSPSTSRNDTGRKFIAYEAHGVREYWILDPSRLEHRFYRLIGDTFEEFAVGADRIDSASIPGFWVKRAWLDPDHLPRKGACLAEILSPRRSRSKS
jgi:Uma2 family endonuclease